MCAVVQRPADGEDGPFTLNNQRILLSASLLCLKGSVNEDGSCHGLRDLLRLGELRRGRVGHSHAVDGHSHRIQPIVHIHGEPRAGTCQRREQEARSVAHVVAVEILGQGRVGLAVVDGVLDEGLLLALCLANGRRRARL
eukprot:scaffold1740_cov254-Pinguiococcus_pyrenoidosus.AAC.12